MKLFQKIARDAIKQAEGVVCPFATFVEGLEEMQRIIKERLELARDELKNYERNV